MVEGTGRLQNVAYTYNIRGWLKDINNVNSLGSSLFAMKFNYATDEMGAANDAPQYNGNISEIIWRSVNDVSGGYTRGYAYSYDDLNRLTSADYGEKTTGSYNFSYGYSVPSISYDKNGNIMTLERKGYNNALIDNLTYSYNAGNQLQSVSDASGNTQGFDDGHSGTDYAYDGNGNLTEDLNKNITSITYNYLNLPKKITFGSSGNIQYIYAAEGTKLRKVVTSGSTVTTTDYAGNFVYTNNALSFFFQPEGYVVPNGSSYQYYFQYKDNLGSNRLTYCDFNGDGTISSTEIVEENNYYPFGLKQQGYNNTVHGSTVDKRLYNGKELQNDAVGTSAMNLYDYGVRFYDPAIGRWTTADPLAEKHFGLSPYNYTANNPILFIDPNGKDIWIYYDGGKSKVRYEQGMKYKGKNSFVSKTVKYLNAMNGVKAGEKVLGSLIKSHNTFDFTDTKSSGGDRTLQFDYSSNPTKYKNGGGEIHAASLMNSKITSSQKVAATSHELFHGYERENGQNPATINGEVGAYLFGRGVSQMYEQSIYGGPVGGASFGNSTKAGQAYNMAMLSLLYGWGNVKSNYNTAINNFRQGASVNNSGIYNGDNIDPAYFPLIYGFIPLVK